MTSARATARPVAVEVRTIELTGPATESRLLDALPAAAPLAWVRTGEGLVAWGELARLSTRGPERFEQAADWWARYCDTFDVHDEVGRPGCGPVAFGSLAFDDEPGDSVLVIPRVIMGRRGGSTWLTTLGTPPGPTTPTPVRPPVDVTWAQGSLPVPLWCAAVEHAVARIVAGELDKVVLARDLLALAAEPLDPRWLLARLSAAYPDCWTFAVDGLVGATPELLVRREGGRLDSRVLAGTVRSHGDAAADGRLAAGLLASDKDLEEHGYAARSVANVLARHCASMTVPSGPHVLRLANVQHLVTDLTGEQTSSATALEIAAELHPTAAVCGSPNDAARDVIRELEGMDRGRYAGPVGWIDAAGNGEWGIALRCARLNGREVRLFAGCGIVAGSRADAELAESQAKFVPIRDALGV